MPRTNEKKKRKQLASGKIEDLSQANIKDVHLLFAIALQAWEDENYDLAEKIYGRILQLEPHNAAVWLNRV